MQEGISQKTEKEAWKHKTKRKRASSGSKIGACKDQVKTHLNYPFKLPEIALHLMDR